MATPGPAIPQARIVRKGGQLVAPPPAPPRPRGVIAENLMTLASVAIGMWPLTAIVVVMLGLLIAAGNGPTK